MHIYIYTWSILFDSMMMSIYNCILMTIIHHSGVSRLHPSRWPKATCSTSHVPSPSPSVSWSLRQKRVDHQNLGVYTWIIHIYIYTPYLRMFCFSFRHVIYVYIYICITHTFANRYLSFESGSKPGSSIRLILGLR